MHTYTLVIYSGVSGYQASYVGHILVGTRVPNLVVLVILGYVPSYQARLFWPYSGRYPGTKPGCFGHTRIGTQVPNQLVWPYSDRYPGTKPACVGHTRVRTRVPDQVILAILG